MPALLCNQIFFLSICLKNGAAFLGRRLLTKIVYVSQKIHICLKTMEKTRQIVFSNSGVSIEDTEFWAGSVFICKPSIVSFWQLVGTFNENIDRDTVYHRKNVQYLWYWRLILISKFDMSFSVSLHQSPLTFFGGLKFF